MVNKATRTRRLALLSEWEREVIGKKDSEKQLIQERTRISASGNLAKVQKNRIAEITKELAATSSHFSELVKELEPRLEALRDDLRIILSSRTLFEIARTFWSEKLFFNRPLELMWADYMKYGIYPALHELNKPQIITLDQKELDDPFFRNYLTWKVNFFSKNGTRYYWLDTNQKKEITTKNWHLPDYAIRGIKGVWKKEGRKIDVRDILKKALELEKSNQTLISEGKLPAIFPREREDAVILGVIEYRMRKLSEKKTKLDKPKSYTYKRGKNGKIKKYDSKGNEVHIDNDERDEVLSELEKLSRS